MASRGNKLVPVAKAVGLGLAITWMLWPDEGGRGFWDSWAAFFLSPALSTKGQQLAVSVTDPTGAITQAIQPVLDDAKQKDRMRAVLGGLAAGAMTYHYVRKGKRKGKR